MRSVVIWGDPVGKPRQTQRDKWKRRECVERYRTWADAARLAVIAVHGAGELVTAPRFVAVRAFFTLPKKTRRPGVGPGSPHRSKPDVDNLLKASLDALWKDDERVAEASVVSCWDDGNGARVEISWQ